MEFLHNLSNLLFGYITSGLPFAFFHVVVIFLVGKSWIDLNREASSLNSWDPLSAEQSFEGNDTSETVSVLDQFIAESRELGAGGVFVPMTDFSDRLDSAIEGRVAELHDRTNLF